MVEMKTPGVYVVERNAFPNSVLQVETAVPAFVGYTEKAENGSGSLRLKPWRISSLSEFHRYFGMGPAPLFDLTLREPGAGAAPEAFGGASVKLAGAYLDMARRTPAHALHEAMRLFFGNGGGACWIVSVGGYDDEIATGPLLDGLTTLEKEAEPTLLVIPETTRLARADSAKIHRAMLAQCGTMRSRFAILDIRGGWRPRGHAAGDPVAAFRSDLAVEHRDFGAAYHPWLNSTLFAARDFTFENFVVGARNALGPLLKAAAGEAPGGLDPKVSAELDKLPKPGDAAAFDKTLRAISPLYVQLTEALAGAANVAASGAAMAGIYTLVDNSRGVWKAPANVSVASVNAPATPISHEEQEDLNVSTDGLSINAIRSFVDEGVLVWGARTLDGNSRDWRYINVRRTMIMLEQSITLATKAYVFEPNDENTWAVIRSMLQSFLTSVWKQGGLAGAAPADAFSVHVGLGETMTADDVLDGVLRVTVLLAVIRPAEFIEITFEQQMQKG